MEGENNAIKNTRGVLAGAIVVVMLAVGFYWYFAREDREEKNTRVQTIEEAVEVLSQTPEIQVETNPIKKVPSTNPVEKINPFETTNPFE